MKQFYNISHEYISNTSIKNENILFKTIAYVCLTVLNWFKW